MKVIGILGGVSHYTTIEYYNRIMDRYKSENNDLNYPEIIIYSLSHGRFKHYEDGNDISSYLAYISEGIERLIKAGADFIALAANSPHRIIEQLQSKFNIPIVSALDAVLAEAMRLNMTKGLLLGIKFTMQSSFYQDLFSKNGITLITPTNDEQELINDIVFNRLINGQAIDVESKNSIVAIIERYNVDGVVLGCMRLPVFFNEHTIVSNSQLLNTLNLHVKAILAFACS